MIISIWWQCSFSSIPPKHPAYRHQRLQIHNWSQPDFKETGTSQSFLESKVPLQRALEGNVQLLASWEDFGKVTYGKSAAATTERFPIHLARTELRGITFCLHSVCLPHFTKTWSDFPEALKSQQMEYSNISYLPSQAPFKVALL